MRLPDTDKYLLELAVDDPIPLTDVFVAVRSTEPGLSDEQYVEGARALVRRLLNAGLVEVCIVDQQPVTHFQRIHSPRERVLTPAETDEALSRAENWHPPQAGWPRFVISLGATKAGERALQTAWGG